MLSQGSPNLVIKLFRHLKSKILNHFRLRQILLAAKKNKSKKKRSPVVFNHI